MREISWKSSYTEVIWLSLLSLLLYKLGMFLFFFLIPIQVLVVRRGIRYAAYGAAGVVVAIFLFALFRIRNVEQSTLQPLLLGIEMAVSAGLVGGLLLANVHIPYLYRKLYRLLAVTGAGGIVSVLFLLVLMNNQHYIGFLKDQISLILQVFSQSVGTTSAWNQLFSAGGITDAEKMYSFIKEVFLRNYVFIFFLLITGNWYAGMVIGKRSIRQEYAAISEFALPEVFIWPLLGSWTGILIDALVGIGPLSYLFWNVGLIFLFLYGLQGFSIARFLMDKKDLGRATRLMIGLGAIILFFIPGFNLVLIVGLPGFGLSELWIKYRKVERS